MLNHFSRSNSPMHATKPRGTKTPMQHQSGAREGMLLMDHPAGTGGGGGMPLPEGGPGHDMGHYGGLGHAGHQVRYGGTPSQMPMVPQPPKPFGGGRGTKGGMRF